MVSLILILFVIAVLLLYRYAYTRLVSEKTKDEQYFELTILLGSGGHTGQMFQLIKGLIFRKISRINVLITETDKSSQQFVKNGLQALLLKEEFEEISKKMNICYILRTNQVKQSFLSALKSGFRALADAFRRIVTDLKNTTHFVSNGPGTCVPYFYIFFILKILRLSRVKLIFVQSWCRVTDLSRSGKLVRYVADQFIVHWPELVKKYKKCKYFGQII